MKRFLMALIVCSSLSCAARAQGLIGVAPEGADPKEYFDNKHKLARQLELERSKLFAKGLGDLKSRTEYGSIVWQLGLTYESLCGWQNALAAYNTLQDLELPPNAMANCSGCVSEASDAVIAIDFKRLQSKVNAVESVDHVKFDHKKRLPPPQSWTSQEKRQLEAMSRKKPLTHGQVVTLEEFLKH